MAYGSIYRLTWFDLKGYQIQSDIQKEDYSGSVTNFVLDGESPLIITDVLKDDRIMTKGAKLHLRNTLIDQFEYAKLHIDPLGTYRLSVIQSDGGLDPIQLFVGPLIDDIFRQTLQKNEPITLVFNNGMAQLDRYYPAFLENDEAQFFSEMDIIAQCLAFANPENTIYINSTLYEDNLSPAEKADNPFVSIYLDKAAFTKSSGDTDNANEILLKVLKSYNAMVYEKEGHFYIERIIDRGKTNKTWWRYTPGESNPYDSVEESEVTVVDIDSQELRRRTMNYSIIPAAKLLKLQLKYVLFDNLVQNYWENIVGVAGSGWWFPALQARWYYAEDYMTVESLSYSNKFITAGWAFSRPGGMTVEDFTDYARFAYRTKFTKDPDDKTVLSFTYKHWLAAWPYSEFLFRFYIYLDDGTLVRYAYWDPDTELWELSIGPGQITVWMNNEDETQHEWVVNKEIDLTGLLSAWEDNIDVHVIIRCTAQITPSLVDPEDLSLFYLEGFGGPYGDFSLKTNAPDPDNMLDVDLDNGKNKVVEESIYLFDTHSWNYKNNKFRLDDGDYKLCQSWTDETTAAETLQNHYCINFSNYYNQARSAFHLLINQRMIDIGELYQTSLLQNELDEDVRLYIESMTHDVRQNTFNIKLKEYIDDVGKVTAS